MSGAKRPATTVVGVRLDDAELARLDEDRAQLGTSRPGALRLIWQHYGDDVAVVREKADLDAAAAASLQPVADALLDAMRALTAAYVARASAVNKIGGHTNQMARYANSGGLVPAEALQGVERSLEALRADDAAAASPLAALQRYLDDVTQA